MVDNVRYRLNGRRRSVFLTVLGIIGLSIWTQPLAAHGGGVPRLTSEIAGPYRIFAWTQPEPLRVGDIHLSIAVVKRAANDTQSGEALDEPVTDATVVVHLLPVGQEAAPITVPAVLQVQLGSYYYEADATLPTAGDWRFTIEVTSGLGVGSAAFVGAVADARKVNWLLIVAAGIILLCLLSLIGLWNRLQAKENVP